MACVVPACQVPVREEELLGWWQGVRCRLIHRMVLPCCVRHASSARAAPCACEGTGVRVPAPKVCEERAGHATVDWWQGLLAVPHPLSRVCACTSKCLYLKLSLLCVA